MNKELKPCPFCGGTNLYNAYVFIRCDSCGAEGPATNKKKLNHVDYLDRENAIKLWNVRNG